jgi:Protein of unknown function (DUF2695)
MSSSEEKARRRRAIHEDQTRRWEQAAHDSPLSRAELDSLLDHLAERILSDGYDGTLALTSAWLTDRGLPVEPALAFLRQHGFDCDFAVALSADPQKLFGPTSERIARMPIEREALQALIAFLDAECRADGCDNTLRLTRQWLVRHGHPAAATEFAIIAQGGGCDCEVVLNVEPDSIYP